MTLGGLALAVGILVDDATVEVENINRNIDQGKEIVQAILDGASQIAVPALVSTLSICIVFVPMFFLSGVAKYLFVPLAEAVVFAMLASYLLSRTLVPTMARYLLVAQTEDERREASRTSRNPFVRMQEKFEVGFEKFRGRYHRMLDASIRHRKAFIVIFLLACVLSFGLIPFVGQDFFPSVDSGEFKLHLRAPTGTRIEDTAALCDRVESEIRQQIPPKELVTIIDNIGLPYSGINLSYSTSAPIGPADADIQVELCEGSPADERICSRIAFEACARLSGSCLLRPAGGYRHPDSEFRVAGADRRSDRRPQSDGEPRFCGKLDQQAEICSRCGGFADSAAVQLPEISH